MFALGKKNVAFFCIPILLSVTVSLFVILKARTNHSSLSGKCFVCYLSEALVKALACSVDGLPRSWLYTAMPKRYFCFEIEVGVNRREEYENLILQLIITFMNNG